MMLSEASLEFARRHVTRFYDTDFFPKHFALEAVWTNWDAFNDLIVGHHVNDMPLTTPHVLPWPKPRGGYRIVHQLDPISTLVYTAAAHSVADAVERSRAPADKAIACSYRLVLGDGSFFDTGTGYAAFQARTDELTVSFTHVLLTDITDFYNQIYVHRVRNAIATADPALEQHAFLIERLLSVWNSNTSQGIPVGPAASIVMSEAVLVDVDRFIQDKGFLHTRYVDDFRIFGKSDRELRKLLRDLTAYIYEAHRLNLSGEKTKIQTTAEYAKETLQSQYELARIEIFEGVERVLNPYTNEEEETITEIGRAEALEQLTELFRRLIALPHIDLGLARSIIRKARGLVLHELIPTLLSHVDRLLPVVNDLFLYLHDVLPHAGDLTPLEKVVESDYADEPAFRIWAEWLLTSRPMYSRSPRLRAYLERVAGYHARARLAVIDRNIAWVREHRLRYFELPLIARLTVIFAAPILAKDEREPFLRRLLSPGSGATTLEQWYARSALNGEIDHQFLNEDLFYDLPF